MKGSHGYSNKRTNTPTIIVLMIGAIVSLSFMFFAGKNNNSIVLMGLFTVWVLSPFAVLFAAIRKPFSSPKQLNYLAPIISFGSITFYMLAYFFPGKTPAFIFLIIPFISWTAIAIVTLLNKRKKADT